MSDPTRDSEKTLASGSLPEAERTTPLSRDADITADMPASASRQRRRGGRTFGEGDPIAERYRVIRFIAQGGMGEVYEVDDLVLGEHVALKTVKPEYAEDDQAIERFKREIQLARRVSHPNVCRIFDIGQHRQDGEPIAFLTMEMLSGETLADIIRKRGPMSPEAVRPLLRQMAEALAAAHGAGIVHRDFKSSNVMLVPSDKGVRAVVTDFGLARSRGADASLSATGNVVGTPAYMAPEQVEGKSVGPAADVYALGVVLYEMLTGNWPFQGESAFSIAAKRLTEPPPSPRLKIPNLPAEWETLVMRCLERHPEDRFASAADLLRSFDGGQIEPSIRMQKIAAKKSRQKWLMGGGALLALAAIGVGTWLLRRDTPIPSTVAAPAATPARPAVAVFGFKNLTGKPDQDWLSTALTELLAADLAAGEELRLLPGESVAGAAKELVLAPGEGFSAESLGKIRGLLGADWVIGGSYLVQGAGDVVVTLRLQRASTAETQTIQARGPEADLATLATSAGDQLRQRLGIGGLDPGELAGVRASMPAENDAARLYTEGLAELRRGDALAARTKLEAAAKADPQHPLIRAALARSLQMLGYEARAREEAETAARLAGSLTREQRLGVEGRRFTLEGKWDKAIETYQGLYSFFPDNAEYGLELAAAKLAAGRVDDARATVTELRGRPGGDDPRVDMVEARAAMVGGDFARLTDIARRAVADAERRGARALAVRARLLEGDGLARSGHVDEARTAYQHALEDARAAGDRFLELAALNGLATLAWSGGDAAGAERSWKEALALAKGLGSRLGEASTLGNLALVSRHRDDIGEAKKRWEQAIAIFRELGDRRNVAQATNNLANVLADDGRRSEAMASYQAAAAELVALGDKAGQAQALVNIGLLERVGGELGRSRRALEDASRLARESDDIAGEARARSALAETLIEVDDLSAARREVGDADLLAEKAKDPALSSDLKLIRARLALADGAPSEAVPAARAVAEARRAEGWAAGESDARLVVAEALLATGVDSDARTEATSALALAKDSANDEAELRAEILLGRLAGASKDLAKLAERADRAGWPLVAAEARVAAGGDAALARKLTERGWLRLAKRAGAAR